MSSDCETVGWCTEQRPLGMTHMPLGARAASFSRSSPRRQYEGADASGARVGARRQSRSSTGSESLDGAGPPGGSHETCYSSLGRGRDEHNISNVGKAPGQRSGESCRLVVQSCASARSTFRATSPGRIAADRGGKAAPEARTRLTSQKSALPEVASVSLCQQGLTTGLSGMHTPTEQLTHALARHRQTPCSRHGAAGNLHQRCCARGETGLIVLGRI
jgi:hypothetical protein